MIKINRILEGETDEESRLVPSGIAERFLNVPREEGDDGNEGEGEESVVVDQAGVGDALVHVGFLER